MLMACSPPLLVSRLAMIFKGRDLRIKSLGILQVVAPNLIDNVVEEFGNATFGCLIAGVVLKVGFVGGLGAYTDNSCGVISDVPVIRGERGRHDKLGGTMVGFLLGSLCEDGHERLNS
jgi:hypothetical protein